MNVSTPQEKIFEGGQTPNIKERPSFNNNPSTNYQKPNNLDNATTNKPIQLNANDSNAQKTPNKSNSCC